MTLTAKRCTFRSWCPTMPISLLALLCMWVLPVSNAGAQGAPAGNEHPDSQMVGEAPADARPFGPFRMETPVDAAEKHAFATTVDLSPLRDIAVLHNGRVKILDTLARESVKTMAGTSRYFDLVPDADGKLAKAKYDPLFTIVDLSIDPMYYADKPLIYVDFLPLREAYLERAFPDDAIERQKWKKLTRVSPMAVDRFSTEIYDRFANDESYRRGVGRTEQALALAFGAERNFLVVPPNSRDQAWHHIATMPDDAPARVAALRLGEAWRAMDADGVNAAAQDLAAALPLINPDIYPESRRSLELMYNQANAFEWGYWMYFVSLVMLILAFGTGRKWLIIGGVALLLIAIGLHTFGFVTRCIIAERFAIQNQFESMTGLSLFAACVGLVVMLLKRQWLFGAAAAGTGFLVLIMATQTGIPGESIGREAAILNTSVLLKYHVTTVLTSYGLITLGFICSLFYLGTHYAHKMMGAQADVVVMAGEAVVAGGTGGADGGSPVNTGPQRVLRDLDRAQMTVLQLAFWTLGVGILLGAWWADHSWGRWWAFDPKETWALVTWIVYLIVIHVRVATGTNRGLKTAWLSVIGFFVMLWTYFGVNLLLPGLHAYA